MQNFIISWVCETGVFLQNASGNQISSAKRVTVEIVRGGDHDDDENNNNNNNNNLVNSIHKERVEEIHIRHCCLELPLINAFTKIVPDLIHLKTLNMWNVGLTDESLYCLGMCLNLFPSLERLSLDGNDGTTQQRFQVFLQPPSPASPLKLKHLSLRHCKLNRLGAENLGEALAENKHLINLNLCFNSMGDEGIAFIAKGLRLNRTLASLDLGSNGIDDLGLKSLTDILCSFTLNHEEVLLHRRLTLAQNDPAERLKIHIPRPFLRRNSFKAKPQAKKDSKGAKRGTLMHRSNSTSTPTPRKTSKPQTPKSRNPAGSPKRNSATQLFFPQQPETISENSALESTDCRSVCCQDLGALNEVRRVNDALWLPGNRCLVNLNLSRNRIGSKGLQCLHSVLRHQLDVTCNSSGTGLLRLSLQKNNFRTDDEVYGKIVDIMRSRDPVSNRRRVYIM